MEKKHLLVGILFTAAGILFMVLACMDTPFSPLLCGLAGAGLGPGIATIGKYVYWSRPERRERYQEKMENWNILMKDERSEVLRGKAARYMYAFTLIFLGLTVVVLQVLENYGIIQGARWVVVFLGLLFFAELILARLIYRWLDKKY